MVTFLPRPKLPDMPIHVLDWAKTPPGNTPNKDARSANYPGIYLGIHLGIHLGPHERSDLAHALYNLLLPPLPYPITSGDWPTWQVPDFVAREGCHPDLGWRLTRLICPLSAERWYERSGVDAYCDPFWDDEVPMPWIEQTPERTSVGFRGDLVEIFEDKICFSQCDDDLGLHEHGGDALRQAVQGITGLATYLDHKGRRLLIYEPMICGVCGEHFESDIDDYDEVRGCPSCYCEWVYIKP